MITCWAISNRLLSISQGEFLAMSQEFLKLVEEQFGCICRVELKAMNRIKLTGRPRHQEIRDYMVQANLKHTFLQADNLQSVTAAVFNAASYLEFFLLPNNTAGAPIGAQAHAEFKGYKPKQATFWVTPEATSAARAIKSRYRFHRISGGVFGNASSYDERS